MNEPTHGAFVARRPLSQRIWHFLGFGRHADFDIIDWRCDDTDKAWAPGALVSETYISIDFMDRLRLLVSGKARLEVSTKTDVLVNHSMARSVFSVLEPSYPLRPR